ncbi:transposase [bacterium]|nr:transposase [bacterium]
MGRGSSHVFSEIFLHVNWHCKDNAPSINEDIETELHDYILNYCRKLKGFHPYGIGGTADHIHLVFQYEPLAQLDACLGQIKGASSHEMNSQHGSGTLHWQRGYGIVSFARSHLAPVLQYAANQKKHHTDGTINPALEKHGEERNEDKPG